MPAAKIWQFNPSFVKIKNIRVNVPGRVWNLLLILIKIFDYVLSACQYYTGHQRAVWHYLHQSKWVCLCVCTGLAIFVISSQYTEMCQKNSFCRTFAVVLTIWKVSFLVYLSFALMRAALELNSTNLMITFPRMIQWVWKMEERKIIWTPVCRSSYDQCHIITYLISYLQIAQSMKYLLYKY